MKAFYFSRENCKLRYGDNRLAEVGVTHAVKSKPVVCCKGLHGSVRVIDALKYAPSAVLFLVDIEGDVDTGSDKIAGKSRTYLKKMDCTDLFGKFARKQALIHIEKIKPYCKDYDVVVKWLNTGDGQYRAAAEAAAWGAAWGAAEAAAEAAAWGAAEGAAEAAARGAAEGAARGAARGAAEGAARGAARGAAEGAANDMLLSMLKEEGFLTQKEYEEMK